ncbi:MAG: GH3 auxin-responsive promoter family protein [Leptolyngbyaceae cyanobacterium RM1_1_2]|nr:GH3 auxin-responsive promoter family protein [Leptolyngbyaceae cyanobacterium RM1_1_2]
MTNFITRSALWAYAQGATAKLVQTTRHIEPAQTSFLKSLLQAHQDTAFGLEHRLCEVKTIEQFRCRLPVRSYSAFAPYIERMAAGEPNVLTAEAPIYFNSSSGSTGGKKLIPVTRRSRYCLARASQSASGFAIQAALRHNRLPGKILLPLTVKPQGQTAAGIPYAPVSTSDLRLMNRWSRQLLAHPFECAEVADATARYYLCLLFALRNPNLRVIAATFPVLALQLCQHLEDLAESLIQDIAIGEIASWIKLEPSLRERLEQQWQAAPKRAAQLDEVLKCQGRLTPQNAWPHLSFMVTARAGSSSFYFEQFPEYFGDLPIFGGTYACAEGTLGVHHNFNTDSTILAAESAFVEFIPEEQWQREQPQTLLPWEVTVGDRYRVVFTNYSGFCRYDLGDIVKIEGFFEQAPLMRFEHRQGGVMSATTEKTTEAHAVAVMQQLQRSSGITLTNFCLTLPQQVMPAYYLVNIELPPGAELAEPEQFLQQFEAIMQAVQKTTLPSDLIRLLHRACGFWRQAALRRCDSG